MEHARPPAELVLEGGPAARADAWRKWLKQFQVFLKASGIIKESQDVQASLLINLIGSEGYDIYSTFKFANESDSDKIDEIIKKFDSHFGTKTNTTLMRFKFFTRFQEQAETIDEYVTALKLLTKHCEFEQLEDGLVRDRIVCGVKDSTLRDRLLRTDDLTLEKAIKICHANEISNEDGRQIEGIKIEKDSSVDAVWASRGALRGRRGSMRLSRGRGGGTRWQAGAAAGGAGHREAATGAGSWSAASHRAGTSASYGTALGERSCTACGAVQCDGYQCAAQSVKCFSCGNRGHYKRVCPMRKSNKVFHVEQEEDEDLFYVSTIESTVSSSSKWYENILIDNMKLKHLFKLDTGSDLNILSKKNYLNLGLLLSDLSVANIKAKSFCGNFLDIVGTCVLQCFYKNTEYRLHFVICESDCPSVLGKYAGDSVPARLQRMMLRIQRYDFAVVYVPGKYMFIADTLSRAALPDKLNENISAEVEAQSSFLIQQVRFSDTKLELIKKSVKEDSECQKLIEYIKMGWPLSKFQVELSVRFAWDYRECLEYIDGIIFKDNLVFIPQGLREEMLFRVHEGHLGIDRCKRRAREVMFWPGMARDVERVVRRCRTCAELAARPRAEPARPHEIPPLPWRKVGSDVFELCGKYFLILVDNFSNYIEVCPLHSITSKSVITAIKDQFARHGIPSELITDNGPCYSSKEFICFAKEWEFIHKTSSPNYPQSNGRSERAVRSIKELLKKALASKSDFYLGLLNYRTAPRDGLASPAELMMGRRLATRLPAHVSKLQPSRDNAGDYSKIMQNVEANKKRFDMKTRPLPELEIGDDVVAVDTGTRRLMRVAGRAPAPRSYFLTDRCGKRFRRNRRHLIKIPSQNLSLDLPSRKSSSESDNSIYEELPEEAVCDPSLNRALNLVVPNAEISSRHSPPPLRAAAREAREKLAQLLK